MNSGQLHDGVSSMVRDKTKVSERLWNEFDVNVRCMIRMLRHCLLIDEKGVINLREVEEKFVLRCRIDAVKMCSKRRKVRGHDDKPRVSRKKLAPKYDCQRWASQLLCMMAK